MLHLCNFVCINISVDALVAELVDAADLKSVVRKDVPVQVRPSAPPLKQRLLAILLKALFFILRYKIKHLSHYSPTFLEYFSCLYDMFYGDFSLFGMDNYSR